MANLKIYEWEKENFKEFYEVNLCRAEQISILKKLSRHFLTQVAKKKWRELGAKEEHKKFIPSFYKRYVPTLTLGRSPIAGSYHRRTSTIMCGQTTQLATICHEFTHHLTGMKYGEVKHNKRFKKELKRIYTFARRYLPEKVV